MQFAYEVNNPDQRRRVRKAEEEEETPDNSDVQFNLDLKGLADLLETKDSDPEDVADSKKKLIEKIGKFGHFTTTKVGPKSEEVEKSEEKEKAHKADESEDEQESQEKAEAKRETKSTEKADATSKPSKTVLKRTLQTARENPLRSAQSVNENLAANKGIIGREDDPFRFVQN